MSVEHLVELFGFEALNNLSSFRTNSFLNGCWLVNRHVCHATISKFHLCVFLHAALPNALRFAVQAGISSVQLFSE